MKTTFRQSLSALVLLATQAAASAQPQTMSANATAEASATVLGPRTGLLLLAPIVVAFEPAPEKVGAVINVVKPRLAHCRRVRQVLDRSSGRIRKSFIVTLGTL
jgi:hypothetical protein